MALPGSHTPHHGIYDTTAGTYRLNGQSVRRRGLDPQGLVRTAAAGDARGAGNQACRAETIDREDGIGNLRQRPDASALPDYQNRPANHLPSAVMESVGITAAAIVRTDAPTASLLSDETMMSG